MKIYVEKFPKIYFDSKTGKEIIEADKYFAIELITDHDKKIIQAVINKIKKEADKCFDFDSNGETPITKKALNIILNKIGENYE